ncbi:TadE/TadG family type IV pilus assembly protein [uncultured Celeribacter sp.]|uniref:TadE/TadG family type IV pilus assembly protein n=1 Tax=uncultured Celeribacter sp. TaxID=1303376 RepID=UPI002AA70AFA|nr:TadE/TadG family type IV pilus assembly protein [uncultured Celeribacter sp.]
MPQLENAEERGRVFQRCFKGVSKILRAERRLRRSEGGTATVEIMFAIPVLLGIVMMATDASLLMYQKSKLLELARDASRMVAVGNRTVDEAKTLTLSRVDESAAYDVAVVVDGEYVISRVSVPFNSVILFTGVFVGSAQLSGHAAMWMETSDESSEETS